VPILESAGGKTPYFQQLRVVKVQRNFPGMGDLGSPITPLDHR
jgi:hypothetical protein